jgi:alpha-1,6-mannosyltransferase
MVMLAAQLAVAVTLAEARAGRSRAAWGVPVAAVTAVGLLAQAGAFVYVLPQAEQAGALRELDRGPLGRRAAVDDRPRLAWLDDYLKPTAVVAADEDVTGFEVAAHGAYDVTTPWYLPEVPTGVWAARTAASDAMFAPDTAVARRVALFAQYRVSWLLLSGTEQAPSGIAPRPVAHGGGFRLYRVAG